MEQNEMQETNVESVEVAPVLEVTKEIVVNERLNNITSMIVDEQKRGMKIPTAILKDYARLSNYLRLNALLDGQPYTDKCKTLYVRLEESLVEMSVKNPPKSHFIVENEFDSVLLNKRAILYAESQFNLDTLEKTYATRKDTLLANMSKAENRIPLSQLGEFTKLVKIARETLESAIEQALTIPVITEDTTEEPTTEE